MRPRVNLAAIREAAIRRKINDTAAEHLFDPPTDRFGG